MKKIILNIFTVCLGLCIVSPCSSVANSTQYVTKEMLQKRIEHYLSGQMPETVTNYIVDSPHLPDSLTVPSGAVDFEIKTTSSRKYKGSVVLKINILVDGTLSKKLIASINVRTFENILISNQKLEKYGLIDRESVIIKNIETTRIKRDVFHSFENIEGSRVKYTIAENSIITSDRIEPVPLVNRGDVVTLIVQIDELKVTTLGKALNNGCKNEVIDVQNLSSKKRVKGEVIGDKTVLISP